MSKLEHAGDEQHDVARLRATAAARVTAVVERRDDARTGVALRARSAMLLARRAEQSTATRRAAARPRRAARSSPPLSTPPASSTTRPGERCRATSRPRRRWSPSSRRTSARRRARATSVEPVRQRLDLVERASARPRRRAGQARRRRPRRARSRRLWRPTSARPREAVALVGLPGSPQTTRVAVDERAASTGSPAERQTRAASRGASADDRGIVAVQDRRVVGGPARAKRRALASP